MIILDVVKNNYIQYEDTQCKHSKQLFIHVQVFVKQVTGTQRIHCCSALVTVCLPHYY